jgi:hypothetical protein
MDFDPACTHHKVFPSYIQALCLLFGTLLFGFTEICVYKTAIPKTSNKLLLCL